MALVLAFRRARASSAERRARRQLPQAVFYLAASSGIQKLRSVRKISGPDHISPAMKHPIRIDPADRGPAEIPSKPLKFEKTAGVEIRRFSPFRSCSKLEVFIPVARRCGAGF